MAGPRNMDIPDDKPLESAVESRTFATGIWVTRDYQYRRDCLLRRSPIREGPQKKGCVQRLYEPVAQQLSMFEIRISSFNFDSSLGTHSSANPVRSCPRLGFLKGSGGGSGRAEWPVVEECAKMALRWCIPWIVPHHSLSPESDFELDHTTT
jgi:hypothetical protein